MRRLALYITITAIAMAGFFRYAFAEDVLVVLSLKTAGNNEVLDAAKAACVSTSSKVINLAENSNVNLPQLVRASRAKVVVAVGDKAFKLVSSTVKHIPVIGTMVTEQRPSTVSYMAPPERYLAALKKLGRKQVGVIHSNQMSGYVKKATELAKYYGITIVNRKASSPVEALEQFSAMKGQIDSLWLLPDTNVLTSGSVEVMLKNAQTFGLPAIAFSKNYLKIGAALVIEPDRELIGKIIGESVCNILDGNAYSIQSVDTYKVIANDAVTERLRIPKYIAGN